MSARRLVSVIVATRDRPQLLGEALASIRALEAPDLSFEILVGDNGSSSETEGVVRQYGGHYFKTERNGCAAARNIAMRAVTGEFLTFLDDDDLWLPGHVRPHLAILDARPELEAAFGQIIASDTERRVISEPWPQDGPDDNDFFHRMMSGYFPQVGATVLRGRVLQTYGLMDETLIGDSDWDWQLRVARDHRIGFVPFPCVLFRQRPTGTFDSLQIARAGYTRRIFLRHALPNWRRWNSPVALAKSYFGTVHGYQKYFVDLAVSQVERGERKAALGTLLRAFRVFPVRSTRQLFSATPLRHALVRTIFQSGRRSIAHGSAPK